MEAAKSVVLAGYRSGGVRALSGLRMEMEAAFPLNAGQVSELLHDLGEQLLGIHEVETAAVERLEATLTAR